MQSLDVEEAARKAFTLGRAIFAAKAIAAEEGMAGRTAAFAQAAAGTDVRGKYQKYLNGYIFVSPGFDGRFYRTLPEGTPPENVLTLEVKHGQTPLRDQLVNLGKAVQEQATTARSRDLADAIMRMCEATEAEHSQRIFFKIKQRGGQLLLEGNVTEVKFREFLVSLTDLADELRAAPAAEGFVIASLLIMHDLALALAAQFSDDSELRIRSLAHCVGFLIAPSPVSIDIVAHAYATGRIRNGDEAIVREVAEDLKGRGDDLIETALNAPLDDSFYTLLYQAAAYEIGAWILGNAGAETNPDPTVHKRWKKFAMNAEERLVRIQLSLLNAVANLDGGVGGEQRQRVRIERQTKGEEAATKLAEEFVDNFLYYPRAALPILLDMQPTTFAN
jgi:hypothetical protein